VVVRGPHFTMEWKTLVAISSKIWMPQQRQDDAVVPQTAASDFLIRREEDIRS
jgi:hypothetical protein